MNRFETLLNTRLSRRALGKGSWEYVRTAAYAAGAAGSVLAAQPLTEAADANAEARDLQRQGEPRYIFARPGAQDKRAPQLVQPANDDLLGQAQEARKESSRLFESSLKPLALAIPALAILFIEHLRQRKLSAQE